MRTLRILLVCVPLVIGCSSSDDDKDSSVPDKGVDAAVDTAEPDSASDVVTEDDSAEDSISDAELVGAACDKVVELCEESTMWKLYVDPFTLDRCNEVMPCARESLSEHATCGEAFQDLMSCIVNISSADECETTCKSHLTYLMTSCPCPSDCMTCP
jgi:hypothetical protein